ncbi:MAG: CYTH domain-containing protein [Eubacterium sp.]|nr:CYTH domain-containing protein [Eubacterium sp.]
MNVNNKEIERKYLVKTLPEGLGSYECKSIIQAYISTNPTLRIRKADDKYFFTFKSAGVIEKAEFEYPITEEQFNHLREKTEGNIIEKKRYIIPLDEELIAELDIYSGDLQGFMNVEVEFKSMQEALVFNPPEWFGEEISLDRRYSNASLSLYGLPRD